MVSHTETARLLSGNEAMPLGAYHAGVKVAAAYPGTPRTEILETLAGFACIHAEWSTNEKVALEVALAATAVGDELTAECNVIKSGRRAAVSEITVTNQDGKVIAKATGQTIPVG